METQVEASTTSAGAFFAGSRLLVPDYQRKYSWAADAKDEGGELDDFWRDLNYGLGSGEYFLGLIILSKGHPLREIVDGQQRLVTLTIFANILRLAAERLGRRLVAENVRSTFLYSMDFKTEEQLPRITLTQQDDMDDIQRLLSITTDAPFAPRDGSAIHAAHEFLSAKLGSDLDASGRPAIRVGQWSEFLTNELKFALFEHPDRSAAFRVYEVINMRGKQLTPSELVKSSLIGNSSASERGRTYDRWTHIEQKLESIGAIEQVTTFVRHVVSLEFGYVIPRELYKTVTNGYVGSAGVNRLLDSLEHYLPTYCQLIDSAVDIESSEIAIRGFALAEKLALVRFRPILLAANDHEDSDRLVPRTLDTIVPGVLAGSFSSGGIEAQFARAARRLHKNETSWDDELTKLGGLKPPAEEFKLRFLRPLSRQHAHVARSIYIENDALPTLTGYAHQVRPHNAAEWPGFDQPQYREVGSYAGNWVLTRTERRPQGTRTPLTVQERLMSDLLESEQAQEHDVSNWTAGHVLDETGLMANAVARLFYGSH